MHDPRGITNAKANVEMVQNSSPRTLAANDNLHMFIRARAIEHITAGEQLFFNYGEAYWGSRIGHEDPPMKAISQKR